MTALVEFQILGSSSYHIFNVIKLFTELIIKSNLLIDYENNNDENSIDFYQKVMLLDSGGIGYSVTNRLLYIRRL